MSWADNMNVAVERLVEDIERIGELLVEGMEQVLSRPDVETLAADLRNVLNEVESCLQETCDARTASSDQESVAPATSSAHEAGAAFARPSSVDDLPGFLSRGITTFLRTN